MTGRRMLVLRVRVYTVSIVVLASAIGFAGVVKRGAARAEEVTVVRGEQLTTFLDGRH
jgi:hypothetical protein